MVTLPERLLRLAAIYLAAFALMRGEWRWAVPLGAALYLIDNTKGDH